MFSQEKNTKIVIDLSEFKSIWKEFQTIYNDVHPSELIAVIKHGFELDGTIATRANNSDRAIFKSQGFFLKLLPAVRAGKISFSVLKNIIETESGIRFKIGHS